MYNVIEISRLSKDTFPDTNRYKKNFYSLTNYDFFLLANLQKLKYSSVKLRFFAKSRTHKKLLKTINLLKLILW